jgi:hypothetical protein
MRIENVGKDGIRLLGPPSLTLGEGESATFEGRPVPEPRGLRWLWWVMRGRPDLGHYWALVSVQSKESK